MAEDAEMQIAKTPELPVVAEPVEAAVPVEAAPEAEVQAEVPVEAAADVAAPAEEVPAAVVPARAARVKAPKPAAPAAVAKAAKPGRPRKAVSARKAKSPAAAKPARTPVPAALPAPQAAVAPATPLRGAKRKTTEIRKSTPKIGQGKPKLAFVKESFMATQFDLTQIQTAFADIQGKAKEALEKSTAALGEANDFAKGNVEAVVESGKVLSAGLQDLGASLVAEARTAFEGLTTDAKELAAAKSPTEFFQLQSALVRKQFDGAVAQASKNTEALLKLANATFAPLTSRVTIAVEKVSKAA